MAVERSVMDGAGRAARAGRAASVTARASLVAGVLIAGVAGRGGVIIPVAAARGEARCGATGPGACYYVDAVAGSDANAGTSTRPFRTVQRAADVVGPGDVVIVRNGVYTGSGKAILSIARGGTALHYVTFAAEHRSGAVLDGQGNMSADGVHLAASFVRIEGFEIRGVWHDAISPSAGVSDFQIVGNHIHDIGRRCETRSIGLSAVGVGNDNVLVEGNLIHDIGRYGPGENGCSQPNEYWQNHDHGVYLESGTNVVIQNNIFYNMVRGWPVHRYSGHGGVVDGLSIVNNTFCCGNPNKIGEIILASDLSHAVIANNIFYQPTTAGIRFAGGAMRDVTVANNLTSSGPIGDATPPGVSFSNNVSGVDPRFVNAAGFDFHLRAGSPAIDAGLARPGVATDFAGTERPRGAAWDIGAFEFR
jgi:parallel beta helix pectate lyase-like protein